MIRIKISALALLSIFTLNANADLAPLHSIGRFDLGGKGGWDYLTVDSQTHRLFVARADRVMVIDTESGKLLAEIPDVLGTHGVALVKDLGKGFATAGKAGKVVEFDLATLKRTPGASGEIQVGKNPDAILYDPASKKLFVFNGKDDNVSVIDPVSHKIVRTIELSGKPEFAATDGAGKVFVNIENNSELSVIDSRALKVLKVYPLAPCEEPTGLSMDVTGRKLFAGCGNSEVAVVNADTGKVLQVIPAGKGIDATAFDPTRGLIYASAGEGKLTVISESKDSSFSLNQDLTTVPKARTLAIDPVSGKVFLASALFSKTETSGRPVPQDGTFFILVLGR